MFTHNKYIEINRIRFYLTSLLLALLSRAGGFGEDEYSFLVGIIVWIKFEGNEQVRVRIF